MKRTMFAAFCVAVAAVNAAAQDKPDFSGRWTSIDSSAGRGGGRGGGGGRAGDMGSGWGATITLAQTTTRLNLEYVFFSRGDMQPALKFVYPIDGTETTNSVMMGRGIQKQPSTSIWSGAQLVITTVYTFPHPVSGAETRSEVKQALSMPSRDSLIVETTRAGVLGGQPTSTRTVYLRVQQ